MIEYNTISDIPKLNYKNMDITSKPDLTMHDQVMQDHTMPDMSEKKKKLFPLPQRLDYDLEDENGTIMPLYGKKKENSNHAVNKICDRLFEVIGTVFVPQLQTKRFKSFVRAQVRGNLYAVIAELRTMTVNKYVKIYWENYNDLSDVAFMQSMYNVFMRSPLECRRMGKPQQIPQRIPLPSKPIDHEPNYKRLMKLDSVDLEIITEMANNQCWNIDYCLDKIMTKAYRNVTKDNFDATITHNFADDVYDSPKTKEISTKTDIEVLHVSTQHEMSQKTKKKLPLPQRLDYNMEDENGTAMPIDPAKKEILNNAVNKICDRMFEVIGTVFVPQLQTKRFKTFVRAQVRGRLYALIATLPPMAVNEYANIYWENYNDLSDVAFMQSMQNVFKKIPFERRRMQKPQQIPQSSEPMDHEPNDSRLTKLDSVDLEITKEKANNQCIDHNSDKIMTEANKNVTKDNPDAMETDNFADDVCVSPKTEEMSKKTDIKDNTQHEDLSGITYEQLLDKIESDDDVQSVEKFIDIRLAKMLPQIKAGVILAGLRGIVRPIESYAKRVGVQHLELKTSRKLYYATIATQKLSIDFLLKSFSLVAAYIVKCEPLEKLDYEMRIVCTFSVHTYRKILSQHLNLFKGYRMFALKTFPEEDDAEDVLEDESEQMEADWASYESNFIKYFNEMY